MCGGCFSDSIIRKTAKTVAEYSMIRRGDDVAVAVSGGKDSLSLLHVLKTLAIRGGYSIRAVTIDEGIPEYRDEALGIVKEYCHTLKVPCTITSYKELYDTTLQEALERGPTASSCSTCGVLRRRAIDVAAADADVVATAHNLDDCIQTFMINMMAGDVARIPWMDPGSQGRHRHIKPFGGIYESEIVFYAFTNNIPFQTEPCPHMNDGIRTPIREFLNSMEEKHSGIKNSMYRAVLATARAIPNTKTQKVCRTCGGMTTGEVCGVCTKLRR